MGPRIREALNVTHGQYVGRDVNEILMNSKSSHLLPWPYNIIPPHFLAQERSCPDLARFWDRTGTSHYDWHRGQSGSLVLQEGQGRNSVSEQSVNIRDMLSSRHLKAYLLVVLEK